MPDVDPPAICAFMLAAAAEAAQMGLGFARNGAKSWTKGDNSIVTEADLAIDAFLKQRLTGAFPHFGWLSEETADNAERLGKETLFVIDPIDGTRAFARGAPDWTISLALVHQGQPLVAVLAEPVAGRMMSAIAGEGAHVDGRRMTIGRQQTVAGARIGGAKPSLDKLRERGALEMPKVFSLALRIAKVALDELDVALSHAGPHDWDVAAADLLVQEAGGQLVTMDGARVSYNQPTPRHAALVAASASLCAEIAPIFAELDRTSYSDTSI